jgi:uncharacterized membrane protein
MGPLELMLIVFAQEDQASAVLKDLMQLEKQRRLKIFDAVVLIKDQNGITSLKETHDMSAGRGAVVGAVTGGLLGLLAGPAGLVLGAVTGAATGGVAAGKIDLGFSNRFLDDLKRGLKPGRSALLVLVEQDWSEDLALKLATYPGRLFRHTLKENAVRQLGEL